MSDLHIVLAQEDDLERYIDLLEEIADWLEGRGVKQWRAGNFRLSRDYYRESIKQREAHLAFVGDELVGTYRLLLRDPIVWPDVAEDDALYVHNLAVRRAWGGHRFGTQMLESVADRAACLGRSYVRLDCMADSQVLRAYYVRAGFGERGEIEARFPAPVGTLDLARYEKPVWTRGLPNKRLHPSAARL